MDVEEGLCKIAGVIRMPPAAGERLSQLDFPNIQVNSSLPGAAGETVVIDGQLRLTPGAVVESKEKQTTKGTK